MARRIASVKIGDRFIVNAETTGFEYGVIVESISEEKNIHNKEVRSIRCKYVSGESRWKKIELWQKTIDLKRYKGK